MYYTHTNLQASLLNFESMGFNLTDDTLVKKGKEIPWDELLYEISPLYSNTGRNSKSIRMMLGLELAKLHFKDVSDEMMVEMLKSDVSLMIFCGFEVPVTGRDIPDSSSMTKFRNKLTPEVLQRISDIIARKSIQKLPRRKRTQVSSDSSCLPANIAFPTDSKVLGQATDVLVKAIENLRNKGKDIIIRGRRKITKLRIVFQKKRRRTRKEIRSMNRLLINFNKRLLGQVKTSGKLLTKKLQKQIEIAKKIVKQQEYMYKKKLKSVPNRIVSLHEDKLRPIYRGKAKQATEFGKKVSLMVVGQKVAVPHVCESDNFSDTELPMKDVKRFKEITGNIPKEYSGDRGLHSPKNHNYLQGLGIHDGIAYRGKIPKKAKLPPPAKLKRIQNQRSPAEGKLGTLKMRYGCAKIPYKAENTDIRFVMAGIMHNLQFLIS